MYYKNCIEDTLEIMSDYAKSHESFDASFLFSIREEYEDRGCISYGQREALLNIFKSFKMREWNEVAINQQ